MYKVIIEYNTYMDIEYRVNNIDYGDNCIYLDMEKEKNIIIPFHNCFEIKKLED